MPTLGTRSAGFVGDPEEVGNEWVFALADAAGERVLAFVFETENAARHSAKLIQSVVESAKAIVSVRDLNLIN